MMTDFPFYFAVRHGSPVSMDEVRSHIEATFDIRGDIEHVREDADGWTLYRLTERAA